MFKKVLNRNLHCMCLRFHKLGLPYVYWQVSIISDQHNSALRLLETLQQHQDHAQHVCQIVINNILCSEKKSKFCWLLVPIASAICKALQSTGFRVHKTTVQCPDIWIGQVSAMLSLLEPVHVCLDCICIPLTSFDFDFPFAQAYPPLGTQSSSCNSTHCT